MKKTICLFVFQLFLATIYAQNTFQYTYGNTVDNAGISAIELPNGEIVMVGNTDDHQGQGCFFIKKTGPSGDIIWSKSYGTAAAHLYVYGFKKTSDGFVIAGDMIELNFSDYNSFIVKLDQQGDITWAKSYSSPIENYLTSVDVAADGSIIFTGRTTVNPDNIIRQVIGKTSGDGSLQWVKEILTGNDSIFTRGIKIFNTADGGFATTGSGGKKISLLKFNSAGNLASAKLFEGPAYSSDPIGKQTNDGGFIITGTTFGSVAGYTDHTYLLKTDSSGNMEWSKKYAEEYVGDVLQDASGGFIITGGSNAVPNSTNPFGLNLFILKTNNQGIVQWRKYYRNNELTHEMGNSISSTTNNGFLVYGLAQGDRHDTYLLKTDANGDLPCNGYDYTLGDGPYLFTEQSANYTVSNIGYVTSDMALDEIISNYTKTNLCLNDIDEPNNHDLMIYPNPTDGIFNINGSGENDVIKIIDIHGKTILMDSGNNKSIDMSNFPKGIYLIKLVQNNNTSSFHKIVLQ